MTNQRNLILSLVAIFVLSILLLATANYYIGQKTSTRSKAANEYQGVVAPFAEVELTNFNIADERNEPVVLPEDIGTVDAEDVITVEPTEPLIEYHTSELPH